MISGTDHLFLPTKCLPVDGISIAQQISRLLIRSARLQELPRFPSRCRMRRHVDVKHPPSIVAQNDQDEKDPECCGRNCEEIKCDNFFGMVLKKCPPRLRRRSTALDHVLRDRSLRNLIPKLQQFSMNPRRAPQRIGPAHASDKVPDLRINPWACAAATLPAPVVPEALPVPAYNYFRLNDMK